MFLVFACYTVNMFLLHLLTFTVNILLSTEPAIVKPVMEGSLMFLVFACYTVNMF